LLLCLARLPEPRGGRDRERITDEVTADEVSPTLGGVLEMEQTSCGKKSERERGNWKEAVAYRYGRSREKKKEKKEGKRKEKKGKRKKRGKLGNRLLLKKL
jgi:hypothetical protein